jgi:hypothetical protein
MYKLIFLILLNYGLSSLIQCEMILEMDLIQFVNPSNKTYSNKPCGGSGAISSTKNEINTCQIGFLFCLVDLPFRNPQNCSLGDYTTTVLGSNSIKFIKNETNNYNYKFIINKMPSVRRMKKKKEKKLNLFCF